jgi:hypothetical protein
MANEQYFSYIFCSAITSYIRWDDVHFVLDQRRLVGIFFRVLGHWNSPRVYMSLHSDTLFRKSKPVFAMCLARSCKYQLYSLWFHPTETQSTTLEASTAITPPMRFKFSGKYERYTCNQDWFYSSYFTDYTNQDFYNVCQLKIQ